MKRIFFVLIFAIALMSVGSVRANDVSDAYNESLVKYRYKTDEGKKTFKMVVTYRHLSPTVRSERNDCWWDYNEFMNCKVSDRSIR